MQYRVLIAILSFRNKNSDTCYPKRESIAKRCGYSIANVSRVTAQLVELGWLEKVGKGGRSAPSTYRVTVPETVAEPETVADQETVAESETVADPATVADPNTKTVAGSVTKTVADPARGKEQTKEQTNEQKGARKTVLCPQGVSNQVWSDFLAHRRSMRATLTPSAWTPMEKAMRELEAEGWTPDDVLSEVMSAGWRAFRADWIRNRCGSGGQTRAKKGNSLDDASPL
jgi:hypothetical protein